MAQGKIKVKSKVPDGVKSKNNPKGKSATQRSNRPIKPKKKQQEVTQKLKQNITKAVNKSVEEEIRARATSSQKISKAQQAVAEYNSK